MSDVAIVRTYRNQDGTPHSTVVETYCPGCQSPHPFRIDNTGCRELPTWEWDGNIERPTFSPSLLCHGSVHRCPEPHWIPCAGIDCGHIGHAILDDGTLATMGPHTIDPAYGPCHSFLRDGRWEFLGDSAHHLAGQTVDMVPIPEPLKG